jgi:hypothetical protein
MTGSTTWHECAIDDCHVLLSLEMLMCPQHWRKVPAELKTDVWRTYRAWQRAVHLDDLLSALGALRKAQAAAVAAVTVPS